jgi:hypothetical protein
VLTGSNPVAPTILTTQAHCRISLVQFCPASVVIDKSDPRPTYALSPRGDRLLVYNPKAGKL